jgi:TldD protein
MLSQTELEEILNISLSKGGDFADIFIEEAAQTSVTFEDNKIDKISSGTDVGAGIRVMDGNTIYYAASEDILFEPLKEKAFFLANSINKSPNKNEIGLKPVLSPLNFEVKKRPDTFPISEKVDVVRKANDIARSYGHKVRQVTIRYIDTNQAVTVANSLGSYIEDNRIRTRFAVNVVAAKDGMLQTGFEGPGGTVGFEFFEVYDPEKITRMAAERALLMLDAKHAPSGKMPVVMSAEAGGTMVHEACGHALEADFIQKGTSIFTNKIGQKVASELVTVVDDATIPGNYGSFRFDDEGTPSQKKILIENGILKGYMSDRFNASLLGSISSGNGRRESFRTKPVPRMTNTFIQAGLINPAEIIASIKNGLFIKKMGGGEVNVTNGDFVFEITEAYLIENGKVKHPVRGAMLIGNGPHVLQLIDMVGWDLDFQPGTCGKYDHVPVSHGQPTIRIPEITIGGRS